MPAGRDGSDPVVAVPASSRVSRSPLVGAFIVSSIGYRFAIALHPPVWVVPKLETIRMNFFDSQGQLPVFRPMSTQRNA